MWPSYPPEGKRLCILPVLRENDKEGDMMTWKKVGRTVRDDGSATTRYESGRFAIESRKRPIPHANGRPGVWFHTTYFLAKTDGSEKEYYSLKEAKAAAEKEENR